MKNFYQKYRLLVLIGLIVIICLLPTLILAFYANREFVDIGLLTTSIMFIVFVLPIYNMVVRYNKEKSGKK